MAATITEATPAQKVAVLNDLASLSHSARTGPNALENQSKIAGQKHGLAWGVVRDVAHDHGWPNPDSMGRAADAIQANLEKSKPTPHPRPTPPSISSPPTGSANFEVFQPDTLQALINAAAKSDAAATRKLGERLEEIAEQIRTRVGEEAKAAQIKAERDKERKDREAEIAKLQARLAELRGTKAKPKPKGSAPAAESETSKARAWAQDQGIRVGSVGRVPTDVLEAYRKVAS